MCGQVAPPPPRPKFVLAAFGAFWPAKAGLSHQINFSCLRRTAPMDSLKGPPTQPPSPTKQQPPTTRRSHDHEAESVPGNVFFCWRYEQQISFSHFKPNFSCVARPRKCHTGFTMDTSCRPVYSLGSWSPSFTGSAKLPESKSTTQRDSMVVGPWYTVDLSSNTMAHAGRGIEAYHRPKW